MCACVGGAAPLRKLGAVPPTSYMWRTGAGGVNMFRKEKNSIPPGVPHASLGHRRFGGVRHRLGAAEAAPPDHVRNSADGPVRGKTFREAPVSTKIGFLGRAAVGARRVLCVVVSLVLSCNLVFTPRIAFAVLPAIPGIVLTTEFLSAAFPYVVAGLTGVAVGGTTMSYGDWAARYPDRDLEFRDALANYLVTQNVDNNGVADQISLPLNMLPSTLIDNIITTSAKYYYNIPDTTNISIPDFVLVNEIPNTINSYPVVVPSVFSDLINANCACSLFQYTLQGGKYHLTTIYNYSQIAEAIFNVENTITLSLPGNLTEHFYYCAPNGSTYTERTTDRASNSMSSFQYSTRYPYYYTTVGVNYGNGFITNGITNVNTGLNNALNSYKSGSATIEDVNIAVNEAVGAIRLPGLAIDTSNGVVESLPQTLANGVIYNTIVYTPAEWTTIEGGGTVSPDVPVPGDVLSGLQSIITLLTQTFDVVTGIPPYLSATLENGTIIDIPHTLNDILGAIIDTPPTLEDLLDGVTIDIPAAIDDAVGAIIDIPGQIGQVMGPIVGGIPGQLTGLQGTLSNVLSGVTTLPATIAGALGLDWVLDGVDELRERLPEIPSGLVLPQATFAELQSVMGDYRDNTPVGKIFDAYEGVFDVMSEPSGGPPRYEIVFPAPINWSFVIDFAIFDGQFVMLSHAVFYLLAVFWYLKFLKTVRGWYEFFCGWGSRTLTVAEVQSMHDEGVY